MTTVVESPIGLRWRLRRANRRLGDEQTVRREVSGFLGGRDWSSVHASAAEHVAPAAKSASPTLRQVSAATLLAALPQSSFQGWLDGIDTLTRRTLSVIVAPIFNNRSLSVATIPRSRSVPRRAVRNS